MARVGSMLGLSMAAALLTGCAVSRAAAPAPAPATMPAAVLEPAQRVVAYPHGAWVLRGAGSPSSPYAWVWVPVRATPAVAR